jgi:DNA-binding NarL/FixJ family response regulator
MNKILQIFLADDHAVVREGLKRLIEAEADMEICGEADNGAEIFERLGDVMPDIFVLDISLPEISGVQATRKLKALYAHCMVLILTVHEDTSYVREVLQAGASGYVLKRSASHELIQAIRAVANGGLYIDPHVSGKLVSTLIPMKGTSTHPFVDLSERETAVLRYIAQGYSNREIAENLKISTKTVETYKARSMEKLGLHTRVELIRAAVQRGWLRGEALESEAPV